ncbi:MAG: Uma2 family endonuclease [Verrucomicrobiae bacterium]|nr:Uma2 family endonuclease [Verrucomicrobiae bacterium]
MTATQSFLQTKGVSDRVHPLSVEAYHALGEIGRVDENVELLRGIVVDKMSKSPLHSAIVRRLFQLLFSFIGEESDLILLKEDPLTLSDSEPEPDLAIVNAAEADNFHHHPTTAHLVVEVAVSSVEIDRLKASIYAEAGIPEFWLVRPAESEIDVFSQPKDGNYHQQRTLRSEDSLTCAVFPKFSIKAGELLRQSAEN